MLERVTLHQTRFRVPGLTPDARGVAMGDRGFLLFPSLDRCIAFLRVYSRDASLDELIPTLRLEQLVTSLKTRELAISFGAGSSSRMDRIAAMARLSGGLVFTGTARHFVKFRDSSSPLGYDSATPTQDTSDVILYHDSFEQSYRIERTVALRDLVLKLGLEPDPRSQPRERANYLVTVEMGLAPAVMRYVVAAGVDAATSLLEWTSASAFEDGVRRAQLFQLNNAEARIVRLFASLPGVTVFVPLTATAAVELGHKHPVALQSCNSLFDANSLVLFRANGPVDVVAERPRAVSAADLLKSAIPLREVEPLVDVAQSQAPTTALTLPVRLRPSTEPWRNVKACVIDNARRDWLVKILYLLPPHTLSTLRIATSAHKTYVLHPEGAEAIPIGTFYSELLASVYAPSGYVLEPALEPEVLLRLLRLPGNGRAFFDLETSAIDYVPEEAFGPITRLALSTMLVDVQAADAPQTPDRGLPEVLYGDRSSLPLWGVPAKDAPLSIPPPADDT